MGVLDFISGGKGLRNPKSIRLGGQRLSQILEAHEKFHRGLPGGVRSILDHADLSYSDLRGRDLTGSVLAGCNLRGADVRGSKLGSADLSHADLRSAALRNCDLTKTNPP